MARQRRFDKLTNRDILGFVHNAQLALADKLPDEQIATAYQYKQALLQHYQDTPATIPNSVRAAVLVSVAYELIKGEVNGNNKTP